EALCEQGDVAPADPARLDAHADLALARLGELAGGALDAAAAAHPRGAHRGSRHEATLACSRRAPGAPDGEPTQRSGRRDRCSDRMLYDLGLVATVAICGWLALDLLTAT